MVTKDEMERVWQTGPVGWLKDHVKATKGKKEFTLVAKPYKRVPLDPIEVKVWAKTAQAALKQNSWQVSNAVQKVYPYKENPDVAWTTGVKKDA